MIRSNPLGSLVRMRKIPWSVRSGVDNKGLFQIQRLIGQTSAQSEPGLSVLPARAQAIWGDRANGVTQSILSRGHPDAHRGDGKRFVVRADEKLRAFVELESTIRAVSR